MKYAFATGGAQLCDSTCVSHTTYTSVNRLLHPHPPSSSTTTNKRVTARVQELIVHQAGSLLQETQRAGTKRLERELKAKLPVLSVAAGRLQAAGESSRSFDPTKMSLFLFRAPVIAF